MIRVERVWLAEKRYAQRPVPGNSGPFGKPIQGNQLSQGLDLAESMRTIAIEVYPGDSMFDRANDQVQIQVACKTVRQDGVQANSPLGILNLLPELFSAPATLLLNRRFATGLRLPSPVEIQILWRNQMIHDLPQAVIKMPAPKRPVMAVG